MALRLLTLPHRSPSFFFNPSSPPPKPTPLFPFLRNPNSQIKGRRLLFHRYFSPLTTKATAAAAASKEEEEEEEEEKVDRRRLIAQNIPWTSTAEDIRALFERHGTVLDVEILARCTRTSQHLCLSPGVFLEDVPYYTRPHSHITPNYGGSVYPLSMYKSGRNRGLAFITMSSEEEAFAALNSLNSYDLDGRVIKVEFSRSLKKKRSEPDVPAQKYNVYAGNLAWRVKSEVLQELFSASGNVLSAKIVFQTNPRRPAGYGFVSFASIEEAETAISTFNGKMFMGRTLRLGLSKAQTAQGRSSEDGKLGDASSEVKFNEEVAGETKEN